MASMAGEVEQIQVASIAAPHPRPQQWARVAAKAVIFASVSTVLACQPLLPPPLSACYFLLFSGNPSLLVSKKGVSEAILLLASRENRA
jgi:hypothetical protein